jgi:arylsulfatase A-like enzyme
MNPRIFTTLLLIGLVMATTPQTRAEKPGPNVVIFFTDDQGTLDAGCYGSTDLITPNIDSLSETGVRFTQAYAHTVCCPSRAMLMTGRHPQRSGVSHWTQGNMKGPKGRNMALEEYTLAEALREAGYRTALFGKWHLGAHEDHGPKKQGFDEFFGIRNGFIDNFNHYFLHQKGYHDLYDGTTEVQAEGEYFPGMMVERALDFIDREKDGPFFLYVPFNIPHYPEQALKEHEALYENVEDPARRSYGAIVTTTDHYIGLVMRKLEEHDLRDRTIVIFMSDNGHSEEITYRISVENHASGYPKGHFYGASGGGNTGKWIGNKGTFLEGGIRVPAIINYPAKLPGGEVRDQIVTAMDWYPTVLELCGIERKADAPALDGFSLLPLIESPEAPSPYEGVLHFGWGTKWAVRDGEWKLLGVDRKEGGSTPLSLHNLADAEPEVKDYAGGKPEIVERLFRMHEAWASEVQ